MKLKLKICGLKRPRNLLEVIGLKPDYVGFIFYKKSARYMGENLDPDFVKSLEGAQKVGVFVNEKRETVLQQQKAFGLDVLQLHGQESPPYCQAIQASGTKLIKVFSLKDKLDQEVLKPYEGLVDYFLFDTKGPLPGGNGIPFDWRILEDYSLNTPFFLSGGLSLESLKRFPLPVHKQLFAIDVNSGFESSPGEKDLTRLAALHSLLPELPTYAS